MPTFAETMVTKLETLLTGSVGLQSVNVDGRTVTYQELRGEYDYWKSRVARELKTRPRVAQIVTGDR